jgi:hypothetical protein
VRWLNIATAAVLAAAVAFALAPSRGAAISVSPSQARIGPGEGQSFLVGTDLSERTEVSARLADFVPSATGSVRIDPPRRPARSATPWLSLSASRLVIDGGASGTVGVQARNPGIVAPGDYYSLLLLSMRAPSRGPVPITLTVGAPIIVRVPGELRRSASVGQLRLKRSGTRRVFRLPISNRGNINEELRRGYVRIDLRRGGRVVGRLAASPRNILPGVTGVIAIPYRGELRGRVAATATVRFASRALAGPGAVTPPRTAVRRATVRL